jgi:hypothetical protein
MLKTTPPLSLRDARTEWNELEKIRASNDFGSAINPQARDPHFFRTCIMPLLAPPPPQKSL